MTSCRKELLIPDGKDFVFSIFDDTDVSTLGNIKPVYDLLYSLGLLTTKSVWPLSIDHPESNFLGSETLQDPEYAAYVKTLSQRGFEIAFHGASMESSRRDRTLEALRYFNQVLGFYPRTYAGHAGNKENLYWGESRFTFAVFRAIYRLLGNSDGEQFSGHVEDSPYYWGDVCREHFDYVRTFTFDELNLLNISRFPYSSPKHPYLNACFFTHFANHVEEFNRLLSIENQEKLQKQRGVLIVSTHLGKGFVKAGEVHPKTRFLLESLADRNGYFVPVCDVLDCLKNAFGLVAMPNLKLFFLEWKWFVHAALKKINKLDYEKTELPYLGLE